jgi:hypothetical protein
VLPRWLDAPISLWGGLSALLQVASIVGVVTAPFWIGLILEDNIPSRIAVFSAFAILGFRFLGWLAPKVRRLGKDTAERRQHLDELATRQFNIIDEFFKVVPSEALPNDQRWQVMVAEKMLSCMMHLTKNCVRGASHQELQCSLMVFSGENAENITILARARDIRPRGALFRSDKTIAYYVASAGKFFVVNDLKSQSIFPRDGLSRKSAKYRSILLIPIIAHSGAGRVCVGVVTIDSPRACEFWGDIGDSLATQLMPFIHVLSFVMRSGYPHIPVREV